MKSITVFTPTYNRAYCLTQLYVSLVAQTNQDFTWLIIDDGSDDKTSFNVKVWLAQKEINIQYIYQENRGMHSAHNTAYENINTELCVCIDSDDFMPNNAVNDILELWKTNKNENCAGIIGLDAFKNGKTTGNIPSKFTYATLSELEVENKIRGDKKVVLRTQVAQEYPKYPIFENEKFVPLGTLYLMIDQKYNFLCTNKILCIIEYLQDGSSKNIFYQYRKNPQGFRYSRIIELTYSKSLSYTFSRAIHLVSSCLFSKKWDFFEGNPKKTETLFVIPFGILWHFYILYKTKR